MTGSASIAYTKWEVNKVTSHPRIPYKNDGKDLPCGAEMLLYMTDSPGLDLLGPGAMPQRMFFLHVRRH